MVAGLAYFDLEPEFPCFALILGVGHAILLKKREGDGCYGRIGWAWLHDYSRDDEEIFVSTAQLFEEDGSVSMMDQVVKRHPWTVVTVL
jgi:hypothetical protein